MELCWVREGEGGGGERGFTSHAFMRAGRRKGALRFQVREPVMK